MGYNKVFDPKTGKELIKHIRTKETLALAAEIRMDKEKELILRRYDKALPMKQKINFLDYFQAYVDTYKKKDIRMMQGALCPTLVRSKSAW